MVSVTYPDYSTKAFYLTCQAIEQLEKSTAVINHGNTTVLAAGMWFISIEAFINALLRIVWRLLGEDFDDHKKRDLGTRLSSVLTLLKLPKEPLHRSGIFQRLEEFKTFRNEIFHDRTWESQLTFHKTAFARIPHLANQVDAMQGAIIALELFHAFRHVYRGLDLMPNITVQKDDSFGYVKFDLLYQTLLRPFFVGVVAKHALTSDVALEPLFIELGTSEISNAGDVAIVVKAAQDERFVFAPNERETSIGSDLFAKVRAAIKLDTAEKFQLPRYMA